MIIIDFNLICDLWIWTLSFETGKTLKLQLKNITEGAAVSKSANIKEGFFNKKKYFFKVFFPNGDSILGTAFICDNKVHQLLWPNLEFFSS